MKTKVVILIAVFLLSFVKQSAFTQDVEQKETDVKIQIALLLDTSSSMDGLIDQAKSKLWKIVNELSQSQYFKEIPKLEIALFEYGNDNLSKSSGFIRLVSDLTTDLDKISEDLFALTTYGGDEFCGEVIQNAIEKLKWSKSEKDLRLIFIAGNEEFDQGSVSYKKICENAKKNNIIVNTIFCGNYDEGIRLLWDNGAEIANGKYINIDQNREVAYIETPYDDQIIELNSKLNDTYITYTSVSKKSSIRQKKQDDNAGLFGKGNAVERAVSKSTGAYQNAEWDLVDAAKDNEEIFDEIEEDALPEELQGKTTEEISEYVTIKEKERSEIQAEIQELNDKREEYIKDKTIENAQENSLDEAMLKIIREQAEEKGFTFEK